MNDLEQTWELPHVAVWPKGVSPVSSLQPPVPPPPRDPVVQAALAMLTAGHDRLAVMCTLADQYPGRDIRELDRIARETAVTLFTGGIVPVGHTSAPV